MQNRKQFFRGLFFVFLLACVLTGLAGTVRVPVSAAPMMQGSMGVIINEIAWAGTEAWPSDEWIELYNSSTTEVDLTNWRIEAEDGDPLIPLSGSILSGGYLLLERASVNTVSDVNGVVYFSGLLSDAGEILYLLDETSTIVDTVNYDGGEWPAGSSFPTGSMERYASVADSDFSWVTNDGSDIWNGSDAASNQINGTPGMENWAYGDLPATITIITLDEPDPSTINQEVDIIVTVLGAPPTPTGTVFIDYEDGSCTIDLLPGGTGTCPMPIVFTSNGSKLITASYSGDVAHLPSSVIENHDVLPATITTITSDTPDPSVVNQNVNVSVSVTGGATIPTGTVSITGADTNCTITLSSSGSGTCSARFSSGGARTLIATYNGDSSHAGSDDSEDHQVLIPTPTRTRTPTPIRTATRTRTPTRTPPPPPPPPLVAINEFVPRAGHDWNGDGIINTGDEYIELLNHGVIDVNLSGYSLDDEANIGSNPYRLPSVTIKPGERIVFYGSDTGLLLSDGGDGVRLLKSNGQLADAYNYFAVNRPDQSFCRLPDNGGLDDWTINCSPTPGLKNALSGSFVTPPPRAGDTVPLCPIADTLPEAFVLAECTPFGNNIWNRYYWDQFGWYGGRYLLDVNSKWDVYLD